MAFTYDVSTDVGKVRMLARESNAATAAFTDDTEIEGFLTLEDNDVFLAAALALDTIASDQVLLLKKVKLAGGTLETDGPAVADALRKGAQALRSRSVNAVAFEDLFTTAELGVGGFQTADIFWADYLRNIT